MNQEISLNGQWSLFSDPENQGFEMARSNLIGHIPAHVPGNIHKDLELAQQLPPLWYGEVDEKTYGVSMTDWWYRREFTVPADWEGKRLTLDFAGVDYGCDVYLNGCKVGSHQGMFERFFFDVSKYVHYDRENVLLVHIEKMPEEILPYLKNSDGAFSGVGTEYFFVNGNIKIHNALQGLKSPANLSYDWGTNFYTLGIWKDVTLRCTDDVRIDWMYAKPIFREHDTSRATVAFSVDVNSLKAGETTLTVCLERNGKEISGSFRRELSAGDNTLSVSLEIEKPELWMPWGYGEQPLYTASVKVDDSDSTHEQIAFRDIYWVDCEGAPENFEFKYQMVMNGVKIRTMGSCVTAMDLQFGTIGDRSIHYVETAKHCNMNFLRLHGGQIVYPKCFYDAADREGIMLSADFPIGNCCIENDPKLLDALDKTYINILKQLRNHPSIVEWSGGNELEWYFRPDEDRTAMYRQREAVHAGDDSRIFRDTCPCPGARHAPWTYDPELHYDLYNDDIPDNFKTAPCMRFGEFGAQTPSNLEVWYRDVPPANRWPVSDTDPVLIRKNAVRSVFGPQMWLGKNLIDRLFGKPDDLEDMIKAGQFIGAEGLRYCFDALRAKGEKIGGFTSWDYNEPWPNCAGSFMVDYDGRAVMAYHFAREALAPVTLSLRYDSLFYQIYHETYADLQLTSDSIAEHKGLQWSYVCFDRFGGVYGSDSGVADAQYMKTLKLTSIKLNPPELMTFGPVFVYLCLRDSQGKILAERVHTFACGGIEEPLRGLLGEKSYSDSFYSGTSVISGIYGGNVKRTSIRCSIKELESGKDFDRAVVEVENTGDMMALFCEVKPMLEYQGDLIIDNNFLSVPVGEKRLITVSASKRHSRLLELSQLGFTVSCFNAEEQRLEPDDSVVLYMGRRDQMNREFLQEERPDQLLTVSTPRVEPEYVSYILKDTLRIHFVNANPGKAKLIMVLSDHSATNICTLKANVNGHEQTFRLRGGMGIQDKEPWHLAYPEVYTMELPQGCLSSGENWLEIQVKDGFAAWDFLCIKTEK